MKIYPSMARKVERTLLLDLGSDVTSVSSEIQENGECLMITIVPKDVGRAAELVPVVEKTVNALIPPKKGDWSWVAAFMDGPKVIASAMAPLAAEEEQS